MNKLKIALTVIVAIVLGSPAQAHELGDKEIARQRTLQMEYPTVRIVVEGSGVATGFIFASSGRDTHVLTNYHLLVPKKADGLYDPHQKVEQFPKLTVKLPLVEGTTLNAEPKVILVPAEVVAYDADKDLAVLRLTYANYPYVAALAPRGIEKVEKNSDAWIVGAPLDLAIIVSSGVLSGSKIICITEDSCLTMLVSSVSGYDGNSGGPLFVYSTEHKRFEVLGVVRTIGRDPNVAVLVPRGDGAFVPRPGFPVTHLTASINIDDVRAFFEEKGLMHLLSQEQKSE